jgi:UDP-glucuronate decarboxylase
MKASRGNLYFDYHRENGVDIRVVRIFTYDRRMLGTMGGWCPTIAGLGENLTIYWDGSQTRSFYWSMIYRFFVRLMNQEKTVGGIGNPGEFTMLELAELVQEGG